MPRLARDTGWFKSSKSAAASDNCVEVRLLDSTALVRDSKAPEDGILTFASESWGAFLSFLKG
ncbi:DUF397 domain-containing protein [Saccharopolyspora indica]|uniref:DUF397 domain-containing protein n=1 Tax=Saccharopolyspora indica TaxID=1229659 RepID=UPI0022EAE554|nr:DUF397 domain-containing protein [Saccharopolyspora indica]MDA3645284.1 DUF397 domain-containing protein [Saccharopolyspora indica]